MNTSGQTNTTKAGDLTRRAALGVMAAGAAGFVALGPRGAKDDAGGRLVLDYWEKWTGHEGRAMQAVVDDFNASQREILVRYFVTSNIGQKALIAIAGGSPPDVIGLWNFNVPAYAESGAILPLDELAPGAGLSLDQYKRGVQMVMTHTPRSGDEQRQGSRWWGVVNTAGTLAMYYNKRAFREAGLDADNPPRTIEELDAAHARLVRSTSDGRLERVGFLHSEPGWWSWLWGYHFGAPVYDEARDVATIDAPGNLRAMAWLQGYPAGLPGGVSGVESFRQGFGNYATPQNAFLAGKVAMVIQGPWLANMVEAYAKDMEYGVAPFPVSADTLDARAPVALVDTDVLCIPRGAKHPEASMTFIAFTQRPENVKRLAHAHCKINPLAREIEGFEVGHPNRGLGVHNALADSPRAFVVPKTRAWPEIKDDYDSTVQRLYKREVEVAPAMAALQARAEGYLSRVREQREKRYGGEG